MPIDLHADVLLSDLSRLAQTEGVAAALVGGAVRDLLLGRRPADLDLVVAGPPMPFARRIARELGGSAVELDADWGIARVALRSGRVIDLAKQQGDSLEEDLLRRDLALNAMAVRLGGDGAVIDPAGGLADLEARRIRALSLENLMADPARPLRVLRFAATLDFDIAYETLAWIEISRRRIAEAAPERVTPELLRILSVPRASRWVDRLFGLGIWSLLLPELTPLAKVPPSIEQHLDGLAHSLETVRQLEITIDRLPRWAPEQADRVRRWLAAPSSHGPAMKGLLTLGALVHDVGKRLDGVLGAFGEPDFSRHAEEGAADAEAIALRMRLSNSEREHLTRLVRLHREPARVLRGGLDPVEIYRLFQEAKETTPGLILLALANRRAARGPAVSDAEVEAYAEGMQVLLRSYWRDDRRFTDPPRLLSGADLLALGLPPGPAYSRILGAVIEAQVRGEVRSKEEAIALARKLA